MLLVGFSFGLRVEELLGLRVENIDLDNGQIHLERAKNGKTTTRPSPRLYSAR